MIRLRLPVLALVLSIAAYAQTKPQLRDIRVPTGSKPQLIAIINGSPVILDTDASLTITITGTVGGYQRGVIQAVGGSASLPVMPLELFIAASDNQILIVSPAAATAPLVMVFKNGILQRPGFDYTLSGQTLTFAFTAGQGLMTGDYVTVAPHR